MAILREIETSSSGYGARIYVSEKWSDEECQRGENSFVDQAVIVEIVMEQAG